MNECPRFYSEPFKCPTTYHYSRWSEDRERHECPECPLDRG